VHVAGKTSEELHLFLEQELARYVKEPKVTVQVLFNGSIRYYLLGQFVAPGLKYADRPMRLLEALALGDSILLEKASLRGAYVSRDGKRLPVNFRRLLRDGDMRQNIRLHGGDMIFVPDNLSEQAFVFAGAAGSNARGGAVPFINGHLDILQALAQSGMGFRERAQGRLSAVRVIRSEADRGQFFVVDADSILRGEAANFPLVPGDIVFIPETGVTSWNEALQQILPTLETISGLLNPFVQIKFLSQ
jgi:polysaccharide export outer membrane protein